MSINVLKYFLIGGGIFDFFIYAKSLGDYASFIKIFPMNASNDPKFPRLIGAFFLILGLARLHGGLFIEEKGAYRLATISWFIEILFYATEVYFGTLDLNKHKVLPIFVICGAMALWSILVYPNNNAKKLN